MRRPEYSKNFVGESLTDISDVAHIELDFREFIEIVHEAFRLRARHVVFPQELYQDLRILEFKVVFLRRKFFEHVFESGAGTDRDFELHQSTFQEPGVRHKDVVEFAIPALMLAALMPVLTALRFGLRGLLISRGRARPITVCNVVTLLILASALAFDWRFSEENGALNAYILWTFTLFIELALLGRAAFGPGSRDEGLPPPIRSPREATAG